MDVMLTADTTTSKTSAPGAKAPLSVQDEEVLKAVYTYQFLTIPQVCRALGYRPTSLKYVTTRLKRLADAGYLQGMRLPRTTLGNAPLVYTLARKGINALAPLGLSDVARFRPSEQREHSFLFLRHTLSVNDFLIAASLVEAEYPNVRLADVRHERVLRQTPVRVKTGKGEDLAVVPDGWLDFRIAISNRPLERIAVCLELDRGTVEHKNFARKLRALAAFVNGPYQQAFGTSSITIAFATTAGAHRADLLRGWCEQVLRDLRAEGDAELFLFASVPEGRVDPGRTFVSRVWSVPFQRHPVSLLEWD